MVGSRLTAAAFAATLTNPQRKQTAPRLLAHGPPISWHIKNCPYPLCPTDYSPTSIEYISSIYHLVWLTSVSLVMAHGLFRAIGGADAGAQIPH